MQAKIYTDFDDFRENGEAGAICLCQHKESGAAGFAIKCVGCGKESYLPVDSDSKGWTWDGNEEQPTLTPSVYHKVGCGWHGYLRKGVWERCG